MSAAEPASSPILPRQTILGTIALTLSLASTGLMNVAVFPLFDSIFMFARDISVTASALGFVAVGAIYWRTPQWLPPHRFRLIIFGSLILGGLLLAAGLGLASPALLIGGSALFSLGRALCTLTVGLMIATLPTKQVASSICVGCLAQFIIGGLSPSLTTLSVGLYILFPLIAAAIAFPSSVPVLKESALAAPSHDWAIIRPNSFLAPFSALFICLFLFHMAFGFSLRFEEVAGVPRSSILSALPAFLGCIYVIGFHRRFPADLSVQVSGLIVVAGLLLASTGQSAYARGAVTLLNAGNALFDLTSILALIAIAARNLYGAPTVIAWGFGVSSLGSLVGAALGMITNASAQADGALSFVIAAVMLLLFTAYLVIGMKHFSFKEVIDGVESLDPGAVVTSPQDQFNERCNGIAQTYGLTPRETEIFAMLARGRNSEYIQETLVVSRNTVKAHVKHIYAKLDIHSHQELIDLVDSPSTTTIA